MKLIIIKIACNDKVVKFHLPTYLPYIISIVIVVYYKINDERPIKAYTVIFCAYTAPVNINLLIFYISTLIIVIIINH